MPLTLLERIILNRKLFGPHLSLVVTEGEEAKLRNDEAEKRFDDIVNQYYEKLYERYDTKPKPINQ